MKQILAAMAAVTALAALPQAASAQARKCDRACLTGVMDSYLKALAAKSPAGLKLHYSVKYTENGQRVNVGDGLWRTFTSGPHYRLDVVDEESGQIAMLGILDENGNRNFFSTRIAVEENEKMGRGVEITEIENLVARNVMGGRPAQMAMERQEFNRTVPASQRLSRDELIRIGNSYFTGLDTDESGEHVPFAASCRRLENGGVMANNPDPNPAIAMTKMGCKAQFDTGFSVIVTDIRERRFPVVDREKGLVYALGFFDHDGAVTNPSASGNSNSDAGRGLRQPFSFMIAEVFQIEDARINQIEAVLTTVPYKMESGW